MTCPDDKRLSPASQVYTWEPSNAAIAERHGLGPNKRLLQVQPHSSSALQARRRQLLCFGRELRLVAVVRLAETELPQERPVDVDFGLDPDPTFGQVRRP